MPHQLQPGQRFDGFEVLRPLGAGGFGALYLAEQRSLGRRVALKVLNEATAGDPGLVERFRQEMTVVAALRHPNVVAVYGSGSVGGRPYLAMEYVEGEDAARRLARDGALDPDEALRVATAVAAGLAYVHERDVVHRDVKPANVLLGRGGAVKVADFGICKVLAEGATLTAAGVIVGTPAYMPPEAFRGERASARWDVYAWGLLLLELLTGRQPFPAEPLPCARMKTSDAALQAAVAAAGLQGRLAGVILRAAAHDPGGRPANGSALLAALQEPPGAGRRGGPPGVTPLGASPRRRLHLPAAFLALSAVGLALAARWTRPEASAPAPTSAQPRPAARATPAPPEARTCLAVVERSPQLRRLLSGSTGPAFKQACRSELPFYLDLSMAAVRPFPRRLEVLVAVASRDGAALALGLSANGAPADRWAAGGATVTTAAMGVEGSLLVSGLNGLVLTLERRPLGGPLEATVRRIEVWGVGRTPRPTEQDFWDRLPTPARERDPRWPDVERAKGARVAEVVRGVTEEILARRPDDLLAQRELAWALAQLNLEDEALVMYHRAAALSRVDAWVPTDWGECLVRAGRPREAVLLLTRVRRLAKATGYEGITPHASSHLFMAYRALGDEEAARRCLQEAALGGVLNLEYLTPAGRSGP